MCTCLLEVAPQFGSSFGVTYEGTKLAYLRQEFRWRTTRLPTLETNSYFVFTVGSAPSWSASSGVGSMRNLYLPWVGSGFGNRRLFEPGEFGGQLRYADGPY